jgi:glycerol kinase
MSNYIIALDQGTTSCRTVIFDREFSVIASVQEEFEQIFPKPGWVEHNPFDILNTQLKTLKNAIRESHIQDKEFAAIGITNQRETTIVWNKTTGEPLYNAIVWQDRRTAEICEKIKSTDLATYISANTGLVVDSYFSATKIKWILEHVKGAKELASKGDLLFGTVDTWLIWNLTGRAVHATDVSNASRTMLYNIHTLQWDDRICRELGIPLSMLPDVRQSADDFGCWKGEDNNIKIRITGVAGDQQAALFGQNCHEPGMAKNTYGTGCFMLMNTGFVSTPSSNGLINTIAWKINNRVTYALEGSVFVAGAAVQWLRDGLELIEHAAETEQLASSVADNEGVYFVPAFVGLGAPYWNMNAKGIITGLSRGTGRAHLVRAALEAMAYQSLDIILAMESDSGIRLKSLKVDGGATQNNFLMQFQADMLNAPVQRPMYVETTVLGAAKLAAIGAGLLTLEDLKTRTQFRTFQPSMSSELREKNYIGWKNAIKMLLSNQSK